MCRTHLMAVHEWCRDCLPQSGLGDSKLQLVLCSPVFLFFKMLVCWSVLEEKLPCLPPAIPSPSRTVKYNPDIFSLKISLKRSEAPTSLTNYEVHKYHHHREGHISFPNTMEAPNGKPQQAQAMWSKKIILLTSWPSTVLYIRTITGEQGSNAQTTRIPPPHQAKNPTSNSDPWECIRAKYVLEGTWSNWNLTNMSNQKPLLKLLKHDNKTKKSSRIFLRRSSDR